MSNLAKKEKIVIGKCPACYKVNGFPSDGLCNKCYDKIIKEKQLAANWLLNYHELQEKYIQASQEFTEIEAGGKRGRRSNTVSSPTENRAIKLNELREQAMWLLAVESTIARLDENKRILLKLRREAELQPKGVGRPGWTDYVQAHWPYAKTDMWTGQAPSRQALYKWWQDTVNILVRIAIMYRCL